MKKANKMRIVLFVNDRVGPAISSYLLKNNCEITALVVDTIQPKDDVIAKLRKRVKPKRIFYAEEVHHPDVLKQISILRPDLGICTWFRYRMKKELIRQFPKGIVNLHHSYLPYGRGKYPQVWAINTGEPYGVSIHYINEDFDRGDVIARKRVPIEITDTGSTLWEKALNELIGLFKITWPNIVEGKIRAIGQDQKKGKYRSAKDVEKLDMIEIDSRYRAKDLINQIRSRSFPDRSYAYFFHKGKKVYIKLSLSLEPEFE